MVGEEADGDIAVQLRLDGESLVLWVEIGFQELLSKGWLRWKRHSAGSSVHRRAVQLLPAVQCT